MFGKLMKNEFRSTWKFMVTVFAAFSLLTVFGGFSVRILDNTEHPGVLPILTVILYGLSFFVVFFGVLIYLSNRYYKTMYSTQGYLTHTLPAAETGIYCSKVLVSAIWMLAGVLLMFFSIFVMIDIGTNGDFHREARKAFSETGIVVDDGDSHVQINRHGVIVDDDESHVSITSDGIFVTDGTDTVEISGSGTVTINGQPGRNGKSGNTLKHPKLTLWSVSIWTLINTFLGLTVVLLWIFASMAIGQLSDKHRTLCSILAGIGFYILGQISGLRLIFRMVTLSETPDSVFNHVAFGTPASLLVIIALFSAICLYINHKKLNLA